MIYLDESFVTNDCPAEKKSGHLKLQPTYFGIYYIVSTEYWGMIIVLIDPQLKSTQKKPPQKALI